MYRYLYNNLSWSAVCELSARTSTLLLFAWYYIQFDSEPISLILSMFSIVVVMWILTDFGSTLYGIKSVSIHKEDKLTYRLELSIFRFLMSIFSSIALFYIGNGIFNGFPIIVIAFCGYLIFKSLALDWYFKGTRNFKNLAYINILASLFQLGFALVFINNENWMYLLSIPWLLHSAILAIFTWFFSRPKSQKVFKVHMSNIVMHMRKSAHYFYSNGISVFFQQSPVIFLTYIYGYMEIQSFLIIHRVSMALLILPQILGATIYPLMSEKFEKSRYEVELIFKKSIIIISQYMPLALIVLIMVINKGYLNSDNLILILSFGFFVFFRSIRIAIARYFYATNKEKEYTLIVLKIIFFYLLVVFLLHETLLLTVYSMAILFAIIELLIFLSMLLKVRQ
jgi:O-antigen/teichoic acid export membrane protein